MRRKFITETGDTDLNAIYEYLQTRTPRSAELYYRQALSTFEEFPDDIWMPAPAAPSLPEYVRILHLASPFRAYTLRIAIKDDAVYLLAAFAPGLPDEFKDARTLRGLSEL